MKLFDLIALSALLAWMPAELWAQGLALEGIVTGAQAEPLPFAAVSLLNAADTTLVKATLTDTNGRFAFSTDTSGARLLAKAESLGFASTIVTVEGHFVYITLAEQAQDLALVEVTAQKPLVQVLADRTVFNVENNLSAAGVNGFDLLRKAPGVLMDNNENLIVEGKTGVLIYIDGKPSMLQGQDLSAFLKSLQSTDIAAIEIITQPSSKYDAAGSAGIINILLKKDKSLGSNANLAACYAVGRFAKYNSSLSFNHRSKAYHLFGSLGGSLGNHYSFINLFRIQNSTLFESRSENVSHRANGNLRLGADFFASSKSAFGLMVYANFNDSESFNRSRTPIIPQGGADPLQVLVAQSDAESSVRNLNANANYRYTGITGRTVNVDIDFGQYRRQRFDLQPNFYFDGQERQVEQEWIYYMETPVGIYILSGKADYEQPLWGGSLSLGIKASVVSTDNTFSFFDVLGGERVENAGRSNAFAYREHISAAYANFNRKWGRSNLQMGLRAEQTRSDGRLSSTQKTDNEQVKRSYLNIFPSGGLTHELNSNQQLALAYSKRIERPNYQSLNPFEMPIDELSFSRGNPFLQPQYTDNVKLSHTYKYTLTTSISYSRVADFFAQITDAEDENNSFLQTRNIANQEVVNLGGSYSFTPKKWWNAFVSLNAFRSSFDAKDEAFVPLTQHTLSLYGQNNFTLPNGFQFELSGWYSSPSVWGGTYETRSMGAIDVALQRKWIKDMLSLRLAVSDILFTAPWRGDSRFGQVFVRGNGGWESRQFRLNLSYRLGNNEVKNARKRTTSLEEESKRAN